MADIKRYEHGPHTEAVEHGGVLYLGGVAAEDLTLPLGGQMRQALEEVDRVLEKAGSSKASILQARVNLIDFSDKGEMDGIWREWLSGCSLPARSTNQVSSLGEGVLVEVVVIAATER